MCKMYSLVSNHKMSTAALELFTEERRGNWVRLRTLIILRWFAISGQTIAIIIAYWWLELSLDLGLCFMAVGVSVVANLIAIFIYPENRRLSEHEVTAMLIFDLTMIFFIKLIF